MAKRIRAESTTQTCLPIDQLEDTGVVFYCLVNRNKVISLHEHVLHEPKFSFHMGKSLGVRITGYMVKVCLTLFSRYNVSAIPFCILTSNISSNRSTSLPAFVIKSLVIFIGR